MSFLRHLTLLAAFSLFILIGCQYEPKAEQMEPTPARVEASSPTDSIPPSRANKASPADDYTTLLTSVLQRVVNPNGLVHYDRLRAEQGTAFNSVLRSIETAKAGTLDTQADKLAFWLNAYNVQMLKSILEHPSVVNIKKDGFDSVFFQTPVRVAGRGLTLDQIENTILRRKELSPSLKPLAVDSLDPRIHAALNCAARGCPRLQRQAFTPQSVQEQLDRAMSEFVNSPDHFRVKDNGKIMMSSIIDWFGPDFEQDGRAAGDYLRAYLKSSRPHYETLNTFLEGRSARDIHASDRVQFRYDWLVNRAEL